MSEMSAEQVRDVCERMTVGRREEVSSFLVYAIPKDADDDMTGGRGLVARRFEDEADAEEWVERNSSPDNPDRYQIEEDA